MIKIRHGLLVALATGSLIGGTAAATILSAGERGGEHGAALHQPALSPTQHARSQA